MNETKALASLNFPCSQLITSSYFGILEVFLWYLLLSCIAVSTTTVTFDASTGGVNNPQCLGSLHKLYYSSVFIG